MGHREREWKLHTQHHGTTSTIEPDLWTGGAMLLVARRSIATEFRVVIEAIPKHATATTCYASQSDRTETRWQHWDAEILTSNRPRRAIGTATKKKWGAATANLLDSVRSGVWLGRSWRR